MAKPYRSSGGLSVRQLINADEIQVRIDPLHADLDDEISDLHKQVSQLKHVAKVIESEAKLQSEILSDLQMLMSKAEMAVKTGMKRLNRTVKQQRSNHVLQVTVFGLVCFALVYLWSKHLKRR